MLALEELPLPVVHYPGPMGAFFAFAESPESVPLLCSCAETAFGNHLIFRSAQRMDDDEKEGANPLDRMALPEAIITMLEQNARPGFRGDLCHECNRLRPAMSVVKGNSESAFRRSHGWYIRKAFFEVGISPYSHELLRDRLAPEIAPLVTIDEVSIEHRVHELMATDIVEAKRLHRSLSQQRREINTAIENMVRKRFAKKAIEDRWDRETELYRNVVVLFPDNTILRHHRPPFLMGLELDIFIEDLDLAIEYQGEQHSIPMDHWDGESGLRRQQARDRMKADICASLGIELITFDFDEDIGEKAVRERLKRYLDLGQ